MKKRTIFLTAMLAGILLFSGCHSESEKVTGADADSITIGEGVSENSSSVIAQEIIVEGNNGVIHIGTTGAPYTEMLTQAKITLAKKGWDLQIEVYSDYDKLNQDVLAGTLDAHLFAHQTYIDSYNDVNGTKLCEAAKVCFEKYGLYSKLHEDLTNLGDGVSIGIPQDGTRRAKALLFLQDAGYITLKDNVGLTAIVEDIIENPANIQFVEYNQQSAVEVLQTTDYCVMGADLAILAGLEPHKEVLKEETSSSNSAAMLAAFSALFF